MSSWLSPDFQPGLVSVIIPTYNRSALLAESLDSLINQKHDRLEVLVVDDGSTDDTAAVVAKWQERFRAERGWELTFLRQEHRGGQRARNLGAERSRGEFLNYLDDDDLLTADKIAAQIAVARETGADIVYGPWVQFVKTETGVAVAAPQCTKAMAKGQHPFDAWLHGRSWKLMAARSWSRTTCCSHPTFCVS